MKIKTKKKLNLPELIQHVWENKVYPSFWKSEESPSDDWTIQFFEDGMFRSFSGFHDYDTFTVEVCEELTEDMKIGVIVGLVVEHPIPESLETLYYESETIRGVLEEDRRNGDVTLHSLYVIRDGKAHTIWSADHGIPKSGVLEVENNENQDS